MGSSDFVTLFFLVAAVLIFFQLRSVLGRRTGSEKPPFDPFAQRDLSKASERDDGKVVTLPRREEATGEERFGAVDAYYAPVAMRLRTYALPVSAATQAYVDALRKRFKVKVFEERL